MKTGILIAFSLCFVAFLSLRTPAFANLLINEISSYSSDDWVEIYNDSQDPVTLSEFRLRDSTATNKLDLEGTLFPFTVIAVDWSNKLNKTGDTIKIVAKADENTVEDQVTYGIAGIPAPGENQTVGRKINGSGEWSLFANDTKGTSNEGATQVQPAPTVTPTPPKTPTPTKVPTPTKIPTPTKSPTPGRTSTPTKSTTSQSVLAAKDTTQTGKKSIQGASHKATDTSRTVPTTKFATDPPKADGSGNVLVDQASDTNVINQILRFLPLIGGLVFIGCAILLYLRERKKAANG